MKERIYALLAVFAIAVALWGYVNVAYYWFVRGGHL